MSQTKKKSGGRDISDLKARLGLKKGGPASRKRSGGVVAPPGLKSKPAAVPVPPGARPPAPEIPSAADDPFAAMNALAAVGVAQQAAKGPEIIVVNDGAPVENVETKSKSVTMAIYGGMILVPLIVGIAMGQISAGAKAVNRTISEAGDLHKDVKAIRLGIQSNIYDPLLLAKERGKGGNSFKLNDTELTEALADKKAMPTVDPEVAFKSYMFDMDEKLRGDVLYFYSEAAALNKAVELHVTKAKTDAQALTDGQKHVVEARPDADVNEYAKKEFSRFGIFVEVPTRNEADQGARFGAKLVEIGPPVCGDRKISATNTCPGGPIGFGYRLSGNADGWELKEFGGPAGDKGDQVTAKKLLPLLETPVMAELIKGSGASIAEVGYYQRVNDLLQRATHLVEFGNGLEKALNAKSKQSKAFTFFL